MPLTKRIRNTKERNAVIARVRKFEFGDAEQVLILAQKYASWDGTPTRGDIEGFRSANPEFFFVAEINQKIVGFAYGRGSSTPAEVLDKRKSRKVASIETIAVDEDYRRRGIATLLLTALFEEFKRNEVDLVTLSVPVAEIAAMKLYGKMGFELRAQFLWKRLAG
jgi:[ribosomal protein S18]-alanine N-acetyltransferase